MEKYKNWDAVMGYAKGVVSGKIRANKYRILGCARFLKDLKNPAYDFDPMTRSSASASSRALSVTSREKSGTLRLCAGPRSF